MNDTIARRLKELLDEGAVPWSRFSGRVQRELSSLFDTGILRKERAGRGYRVVVVRQTGLKRWVEQRYPSGLDGHTGELHTRAGGVANRRDSKKGGAVEAALIHLRGFGDARLQTEGRELPVARLTDDFGAASLKVDAGCNWRLTGRVCTVENLEVFLHIEQIADDIDVAIFADGRLPELVVDWLATGCGADTSVVHAGDYDPTGLAEYLRLKTRLGERVELYVPEDLEARFKRYGNAELLKKSRQRHAELRGVDEPAVRRVVELIDLYGAGLEQEALLIPLEQYG